MKPITKIFIVLNFFSFLGVLALGTWWLYLIIKMGSDPKIAMNMDFIKLAKWEGGTFLILLIILTGSFYRLFYTDLKKTKSLQAFFSSLTHELKTPLASIRLQAEVLADSIDKSNPEDKNLKFADRLIEDTQNLETQMDKIIQLSRMEREGELNLTEINLLELTKKIISKYAQSLDVNILGSCSHHIIGDAFAIELILKNLFENTKHHSGGSKVELRLNESGSGVSLTYCDFGNFKGDHKKLGKLFYTHHSTRGSGIGLYLIRKLMRKMGGELLINTEPSFNVGLNFQMEQA